MDYYVFDKVTAEFIEVRPARAVPGRDRLPDDDPKKWLVPSFATADAPPGADPGRAVRRNIEAGAWEQVEDRRGMTVYDKETGTERKIREDELGPLPDDVTADAPSEFDAWDEQANAWAEDAAARSNAMHAAISGERDRRIALGHTITLSTGKSFPVQTRDNRDLLNINGLGSVGLARRMGGDETTITTFRDANNVDQSLTPADLVDLGLGIAAAIDAIHKASWAIKAMDPIPSDFADDSYWPAQGA